MQTRLCLKTGTMALRSRPYREAFAESTCLEVRRTGPKPSFKTKPATHLQNLIVALALVISASRVFGQPSTGTWDRVPLADLRAGVAEADITPPVGNGLGIEEDLQPLEKTVFVLGYASGNCGYVPVRHMIDEGGCEAHGPYWYTSEKLIRVGVTNRVRGLFEDPTSLAQLIAQLPDR